MLEIVEMVGRDGAILVEGLVAIGADKELHGYGDGGSEHDQVELQVLES